MRAAMGSPRALVFLLSALAMSAAAARPIGGKLGALSPYGRHNHKRRSGKVAGHGFERKRLGGLFGTNFGDTCDPNKKKDSYARGYQCLRNKDTGGCQAARCTGGGSDGPKWTVAAANDEPCDNPTNQAGQSALGVKAGTGPKSGFKNYVCKEKLKTCSCWQEGTVCRDVYGTIGPCREDE